MNRHLIGKIEEPALLWVGRRKDANSSVYAPQHFLYFLPLPHGHGSFLPVFGVAFFIWEDPVAGFGLAFADAWAVFFSRFWLPSRKHAHHPISATVSSTKRRWGSSASLARTWSLPIAKSRLTSSKPM